MQTIDEISLYSDEELERIQKQADRLGISPETLQWMLTLDEADNEKFSEKETYDEPKPM